jgi:phospho-N-acetylmuramoyl-pentapeptide-transferase
MLYVLYNALRSTLDDLHVGSLFMLLDQLTFRAMAAALVAFFIVTLNGRRVIAWLRRRKIGDAGLTDAEALRAAASTKANVPTMGGVLIAGAIASSVLLLGDVTNFYLQIGLLVLVWLAGLGSIDDWLKLTAARRPGKSRQGLYAWEKLVFQLGLGAMVGYFVYSHGNSGAPVNFAHALTLPFQATYTSGGAASPGLIVLPRAAFVVLTVLMLAGMSNAVNITDGMDGLAAGITTAVALGLVVLTYIAGNQAAAQYLLVPYVAMSDELIVLAAAVAGACLGFLWWNCSPAQVFMGDTGSLCLGGLLAYIAIVIRQELLLLLMSGVFLVEIASVMLQVGYFKYTKRRTGTGKRIFRVAPVHHHFHVVGWTEQQVVARFWIVATILVIVALASIKVR